MEQKQKDAIKHSDKPRNCKRAFDKIKRKPYLYSLQDMGAGYIIGVDLNAKHSHKKPKNILYILVNSFHFTLQASAKLQTEDADILIQPDLSSFNRSDTEQVKDLIDKGYKDSIKKLKNMA